MTDRIDYYVGLVVILTPLTLGLLQWMSTVRQGGSRKRVEGADATEKIGAAYDKLLANMKSQIDDLEIDVAYLKKELKKAVNHNAILMKQLIENRIAPKGPPDTGELI